MTVSTRDRERVRRRANYICEFCGVSEVDTGGKLTVDHFQPISKGGDDSLENLVYCCSRCNLHKADYWPSHPDDPSLWNPRLESANTHFVELGDGILRSLTSVGTFTINRLRLNRSALVAHRQEIQQAEENAQLLAQYQNLVQVIEKLLQQHEALVEEQQRLLERQRRILQTLLGEG